MTAQEAIANIEDQNRSAARLGLERIRPLPAQAPAEAVQTGSCSAYRTRLRKSKIKARDALTPEERERLSRLISERVAASEVFRRAKTVLLYRAVRGEVRLEALEAAARAMGKRAAFPLCCGDHQMTALIPRGPEGWHAGYCGIPEPVRECSEEVPPEEIDLVVCPCTVFDESCNRMGMGGGFYDRYLSKYVRAKIVSVAFELQKAPAVPMERWDRAVDMTFTEESVYQTI